MREHLTDRIAVDFGFENPEWERIRHSPELNRQLTERGEQWTQRLNAELRSAQANRNQPIEDGYDFNVTTEGTRDRLYVWPYTARAIAHEAVNQSMLKQVPIGDIKTSPAPDHEVPRELGRRGRAARAKESPE